ncbi:MAG: response regulator [Myxococcota bacterium]|nr:response regulator [Myxococcota bacterium]
MGDERVTAVHEQPEEPTTTQELSVTLAPRVPSAARSEVTARLVVLEGAQAGRHWVLGTARAVIGRGTGSDVTIEDSLVSREHAVISRDESGWMVRDLGSRNGTFVNGRRVDVERLRYGDRMVIGQSVLLLAHVDPMHERLLERQKIEALGRLGAGIAHDLNNYFGAILGALEYLDGVPRDRALGEAEVRECMDDVRAATRQGAELTKRLLSFARRGGDEHTPVDFGQVCVEAVELARRTFDRSVRLEVAISPGLTVRGDRGRLHQVMMNLLVNARDAMPRGGTVSVRGEVVPAAAGEVAGPRVRLVIADTGTGMDETTRARLFEPFFTTKEPEKGTGLGMAIALDVITSHGGTIDCDTEIGRGTTFRIVLPAAQQLTVRRETRTPHESPLPSAAPCPDRSQGAVLVVDDEPMVRRTVRRLLERAGLTVIEAVDGNRALEAVTRAGSEISVVLMDLDMPELDGEGATRALRLMDPGLPVVILSGLCDEPRRRRLMQAGAHAVLQKPCDAITLRRTVHAAMETRVRGETGAPAERPDPDEGREP